MKRFFYGLIFFVAAVLMFNSCTLSDTTYTLRYTPEDSVVNVDVTVFEYNKSNERIANNQVSKIKNGFTRTYTANTNTEKVKVYVKMYYAGNSSSFWVQQVYYLDKGSNTDILIEGTTLTGPSEP